jgi:hypothetical protein
VAGLVFVGVWREHTAYIIGSSGTRTVTLRVTLCRIPKDMNPQKKWLWKPQILHTQIVSQQFQKMITDQL